MNVACPICSEILKESSDTVATTCGHVFHRGCLESWLYGKQTCPTCRRENTTPRSLIKLFFEFDDNKANLNLEEILKSNDELTKRNKEEEQKARDLEEKCRSLDADQKESERKVKLLERQKQLDDMALVGLRSIKDDSLKEIVRLNEAVRILKLDLLAEKQLRRMHQQTLHDFDPLNVNYNIASVNSDQAGSEEQSTGTSFLLKAPENIIRNPFKNLNCEAKPPVPMDVEPSKAKKAGPSYIVPAKIQKAARELAKPNLKIRNSNLGLLFRSEKPSAFRFNLPEERPKLSKEVKQSTDSPQTTVATPSTSNASSSPFSTIDSPTVFGSTPPLNNKPSTLAVAGNHPFKFIPATVLPRFPFSASTGSEPSTSKASVIASNQKRMFSEEPKFNKAVPESTMPNRTTFGFPSHSSFQTFGASSSSSGTASPTPNFNFPQQFRSVASSPDQETNLLNGNGPKMSDR